MQKKHIDHSVFATSCELNAPDIASARRFSYPIIRSPGFVPMVAIAHSVFATSCELNSPDIASARRSKANNIFLWVYTSALPKCAECLQCLENQNRECFAAHFPAALRTCSNILCYTIFLLGALIMSDASAILTNLI